jgi:probable HAF family extracellular repeat protein
MRTIATATAYVVVCVFLLLVPATCTGQNYAITDLGTLGGSSSIGYGINASGQVTGYSLTTGNIADAFLYTGGKMIDLETTLGSGSIGYGINASGQVTGLWNPAGAIGQHAFLYTGGKVIDLGTLGGYESIGYGINASGQVTGVSVITGDIAAHAFLYPGPGGKMIDLRTLGGSSSEGRGQSSKNNLTGIPQHSIMRRWCVERPRLIARKSVCRCRQLLAFGSSVPRLRISR